jgi:exonuclease SbcC
LLAAQLDEGEACPVCGATSHPKLASTPEGMPQKEDVERRKVAADDSEKKRQQAEVQATSAQSAWQEQQRQYTDLRQHSPAEGTSSDWQQRLNQAAKEELLLQRQVQDMKNLAQRMILLQKEEHDLDEAQQRSRHDAETSCLAMARAVEAKVRAEADIPEPYRKAGTLKQDIAILKKAIQEYDANLIKTRQVVVEAERSSARLKGIEKELNRQVEDLRHQYTTSIEALKERVVAAGFASVTECRKIQSDIPRLGEIQEAIDGYDKELQQIQGQINQEEIAVNNMPKPDMETYHKHLADLNTQCSAAAEEEARLTNQLKQLTEAAKRIAQWRSEQEDLSEQYKTIGNVYDLISGKNTGVNFERYVLGALLDEVLAAANQRLDKMSRQRYQLQRSHNWEDKRVRQIGLDIEVYDNYTGNTRPASTLSGGETFLASLSLALGLADVVQTYSGGIHLDTIFIDEGFGTLDSEALDYALQSLLELQQGGRLVGIISHVPELRERIDTRLAITKTDRGSTAAFELN